MKPRISIGMPVYNGKNFIRQAIESVLAQSFQDFELIISDNASTDRTEQICREWEARDHRIRYYRNTRNHGAAWNFNRVFHLARGDYFKWWAHDDLCDPTFLQKCVEILENDPSVVLCFPKVVLIDKNGKSHGTYEEKLDGTCRNPQDQFRNILQTTMCYEIFGLIRASHLRRTQLMGNYAHADGVLLARLSLMGRLERIPEPMFLSRRHSRQAGNSMLNRHMWAAWFDPNRQGRILLPYWRIMWEYFKSVPQSPLFWHERTRCYLTLARWAVSYRKRLAQEMVSALGQTLSAYTSHSHNLKEKTQ